MTETRTLRELTADKQEASGKLAQAKIWLNMVKTGYQMARSLATVDGTIDELAKERRLEKTTEPTKVALLDAHFASIISAIAILENNVTLLQHEMDCTRWELNLGYTEWGLTQKYGEEWYE